MNLFARALGGIASDRVGKRFGIKGKGALLGGLLVLEGLGIVLFASSHTLIFAILSMLIFALFLKMANGCTYSIVPFIDQNNIGTISGIVGAGGNIGAMLVAFLFKSEHLSYADAFLYIGLGVVFVGILVFTTKFQSKKQQDLLPATELELQQQL